MNEDISPTAKAQPAANDQFLMLSMWQAHQILSDSHGQSKPMEERMRMHPQFLMRDVTYQYLMSIRLILFLGPLCPKSSCFVLGFRKSAVSRTRVYGLSPRQWLKILSASVGQSYPKVVSFCEVGLRILASSPVKG